MDHNKDRPRSALLGPVSWLAFGIAILAFLSAIDRLQWFHIKPATGTAAAMSYAADKTPSPTTRS